MFRVCGNCGQPGHRNPRCPKARGSAGLYAELSPSSKKRYRDDAETAFRKHWRATSKRLKEDPDARRREAASAAASAAARRANHKALEDVIRLARAKLAAHAAEQRRKKCVQGWSFAATWIVVKRREIRQLLPKLRVMIEPFNVIRSLPKVLQDVVAKYCYVGIRRPETQRVLKHLGLLHEILELFLDLPVPLQGTICLYMWE
jgi:hypothetical protein